MTVALSFLLVTVSWRTAFADLAAIYSLPSLDYPRPYIGNGRLATTLFEPHVYLEGFYTSDGGTDNHRVAIPSTVDVRFDEGYNPDSQKNYTLNMEQGYFRTVVSTPTHTVSQRLYCHLWHPEIIVMDVIVTRLRNSSNARLDIAFSNNNVNGSRDVRYDDVTSRGNINQQHQVMCQTSRRRPAPSVCVVTDVLDTSFAPDRGVFRFRKTYITSIDRSKDVAIEKYERARAEADSGVLWASHVDAWRRRWSEGKITFQTESLNVSTASPLARQVYASFYNLLSSVPDHPRLMEPFSGLSTEGLPSNGDSGRIRYEQELYMFGPLLLLHPDVAELLLLSRLDHLSQAVAKGAPSFRGARFPVETSDKGDELTPNPRALYPSGAVAYAVREYLKMSEMTTRGLTGEDLYRAAMAIANFYAALPLDNGTLSSLAGLNTVPGTTAPNDLLTVVLAGLSLVLPGEIRDTVYINGDVPAEVDTFARIADRLIRNVPFRSSGFCHSVNGSDASIAAAADYGYEPDVLLAYLPVASENYTSSGLLLNDLECHQAADVSRPAYTFLRLALYEIATRINVSDISYADLTGISQDEARLSAVLAAAATRFGVIPRTVNLSSSDVFVNSLRNDLASHGAFLQLILFGYAGVRTEHDRLILDPVVPKGVVSWTIQGLNYRGFSLDFVIRSEEILVRVNSSPSLSKNLTLLVEVDGWKQVLSKSLRTRRTKLQIMAFTASDYHWSRDPFLFETEQLPDSRFMPEVGNGHIATVVYGPWVHMNGLYNGERSASSRARIPSLISFNISIEGAELLNESYVLSVREGIFTETKRYRNPTVTVERQIFAHRFRPNLLVSRMVFSRPNSGSPLTILLDNLTEENQLHSDDIDFQETRRKAWPVDGIRKFVMYDFKKHAFIHNLSQPGDEPRGQRFKITRGQTLVPELVGGRQLPVVMAWYSSRDLTSRIVSGSKILEIEQYAVIDSEEESVVETMTTAIGEGFDQLRASHIMKWHEYWNGGRIEVDPEENFQLAQALNGAFYYLLSSLPNYEAGNSTFVGLSPGGLAHGAPGEAIDQDYLGHIFWDTEMWMFPPVLMFFPDQARLLIEARTRTLDAALLNAKNAGYEGAKFPWESALSGTETTPWPPAGQYQIHVTADIAHAVQQFLYATADKGQAIRELSLGRFVEEIGRFWQSRVTCDKSKQRSCSINDVMGPDEYHYPVSNSVFTNYVAKLALKLPEYVLGILGRTYKDVPIWSDTADHVPVPTSTFGGKVYHPEFEGFSPDFLHESSRRKLPVVKQADVILLGYPLDLEMSPELRLNDMEIYRTITDPQGPAMTWSMFAIGYLELKKKFEADALFEKLFENIQQPFGVWTEEPEGGGAVNFLTGMGGFLQAVLNGYGGVRLRKNELILDPVELPRTTKWSIVGLKYLDHAFNLDFDFMADTIYVTVTGKGNGDLVLETVSGSNFLLSAQANFSYRRERAKIRAYDPETDVLIDGETNTEEQSQSMASQFLPSASVVFALMVMVVYCFPGFL